jgi:hypothetical protein
MNGRETDDDGGCDSIVSSGCSGARDSTLSTRRYPSSISVGPERPAGPLWCAERARTVVGLADRARYPASARPKTADP